MLAETGTYQTGTQALPSKRHMGRRKNLDDQSRYIYQLEHFCQRITERYDGLVFGETDFLALCDLINRKAWMQSGLPPTKTGLLSIE